MILALVGLLIFGVSGWCLRSYRQFFREAIMVPGVITGYKSYQSKDTETGNETTMYRTVVTFEFDNQTRTLTSHSASSIKPKMGKLVHVGVNPTDIQEARIYSKGTIVLLGFMMGLGLLTMGLGAAEVCGKF